MAAGSSELRTHVGIPNCSKNSFNLKQKNHALFAKGTLEHDQQGVCKGCSKSIRIGISSPMNGHPGMPLLQNMF
jgi:hypothetical protein